MSKKIVAALAATFLLMIFSLLLCQALGMSSDILYPYSLARDIVANNPLRTWSIPANPYFFPDVVVSIPIVFFTTNPIQWFGIASLLQLMTFILLITAYYKEKNSSFLLRYTGVIYATIIIYLICILLFKNDWGSPASKAVVLGHHMFAGIIALFIQLWLSPIKIKQLSFKAIAAYGLLFFITAFSDPFTLVYMSAFIFARVLLTPSLLVKNNDWLAVMSLLIGLGLTAILLNSQLNPTLLVQIHDAQHPTSIMNRIHHFFSVVGVRGILLFYLIPLLLMFNTRQQKDIQSTLLAAIVITSGCIVTGLIVYQYHLRYLGIYFPIIVFAVISKLPPRYFQWTALPITSIAMIVLGSLFIFPLEKINQRVNPPIFQAILNCKEFKEKSQGAMVIATYWPAKLLYENSGRRFRLLQTQPDLQNTYLWMYNTDWATISATPASTTMLIVTNDIELKKVKELISLPFTQSYCEGQVLLVKQSSLLNAVAPVVNQLTNSN